MDSMYASKQVTAKVLPLYTEDAEALDQDRSVFLQRALTLINDADRVRPK
jgi:hypothetical protein